MSVVPASRVPRWSAVPVAVLLLGTVGCTSEDADRAAPATIDAFPGDEVTTATAPTSPAAETSASGPGARIVFTGAEALDDLDAAAVRAGRVPASLRVRDADEETGVVRSTTLTCPLRRQRTIEVPVRRDGLLRLGDGVRVVARLTGDEAYTVLGLTTDRAVLLGLDRQGRVRSRASANQIDERWFVREVEDCR